MSAATGLRPSLYAVLGIAPESSQDEIETAFRLKLNPFVPQVLGGVAAASAAYATLRDPARRRAYDEANGFIAREKPTPAAPAAQPTARNGWGIGNAHMMRAVPRRAPNTAPEAKAAPFIAAPAAQIDDKPAPAPARSAGKPLVPDRGKAAKSSLFRASIDGPRAAPVILGMDDAEELAIDGRKGMMILGAIGAVALFGGLLGWVAGSDADEARANGVVSTLPKAAPRELSIITPAAEVVAPVAQPVTPRPAAIARARVAPKPVATESFAEAPVAEPALAAAEPQADPLAPQPVDSAQKVNAAMPLAPKTVARTIDRIGYSCGTVTGTASAGGGVYTVTCSSGQQFRASPRGGRYRFKRI